MYLNTLRLHVRFVLRNRGVRNWGNCVVTIEISENGGYADNVAIYTENRTWLILNLLSFFGHHYQEK